MTCLACLQTFSAQKQSIFLQFFSFRLPFANGSAVLCAQRSSFANSKSRRLLFGISLNLVITEKKRILVVFFGNACCIWEIPHTPFILTVDTIRNWRSWIVSPPVVATTHLLTPISIRVYRKALHAPPKCRIMTEYFSLSRFSLPRINMKVITHRSSTSKWHFN